MSLNELLPEIQALCETDKLHLISILADDLAKRGGQAKAGSSYPVWTPYGAGAAADVLMKALRDGEEQVG